MPRSGLSATRDQAEIAIECLKGIQAYLGEIAAGMRGGSGNVSGAESLLTGGGGRGNALVMLRLASPAEAVDVLRMAVDEWDRDMFARLGYSEIHRHKSKTAVLALLDFTHWRDPAQLTAAGAMDWLNTIIVNGRAGARKTARNKLSQVTAFAAFLKVSGRVVENPFTGIKLPNARRGRANVGARPFTWDQCDALEVVAARADEHIGNARKFGPLRLTFYRTLRYTGLRYSEAARQLWDDIDLERGVMMVTSDKAGRNDPIPLTVELVATLADWRARCRAPSDRARKRETGGFLFPVMPSHHTLTGDMEAAGIPGLADGKRGQWHRFRKTIGTRACGQGVDIRIAQKILRHADIAVTAREYTDLEMDDVRAGVDRLTRIPAAPTCGRGEKAEDAGAKAESADLTMNRAPTQHDAMRPAGTDAQASGSLSRPPVHQSLPARPHSAVGVDAGTIAAGAAAKMEPGGIDPMASGSGSETGGIGRRAGSGSGRMGAVDDRQAQRAGIPGPAPRHVPAEQRPQPGQAGVSEQHRRGLPGCDQPAGYVGALDRGAPSPEPRGSGAVCPAPAILAGHGPALSDLERASLRASITDAHLKYLALMAALAAVLLAFVLAVLARGGLPIQIAIPEFWRLPVILAGGVA